MILANMTNVQIRQALDQIENGPEYIVREDGKQLVVLSHELFERLRAAEMDRTVKNIDDVPGIYDLEAK